ncbi:hypothetical protein ACTPEM_25245, partial [Clostridioides difficile]
MAIRKIRTFDDEILRKKSKYVENVDNKYCDECGIVPVKKEDLPVLLPTDVEFTGKGESPLTTSKQFMST